MSKLLTALQQNSTIENTKGGRYYATSYNENLDFFASSSRYESDEEIADRFARAYAEDSEIALANLLYTLDIRGGKGERKIFKSCFEWLCKKHPEDAERIIPFISELGRWDYLLVGLYTPIDYAVLNEISKQLKLDSESEHPSLLAKWLPSVRAHGKDNPDASYIAKMLGMTQKEYRKLLSALRTKIDIVEKQLTEKVQEIDFETVPTKAMLKYRNAFKQHYSESYKEYLDSVSKGEKKINTTGLFCYEVIRNVLDNDGVSDEETKMLDLMWKNQKDFLEGNTSNVLVMADTSGSMYQANRLPILNSLGLALYIAERNHGFFHNYFMTFDSEPVLQKITGETIAEKLDGIESIVSSTNIDKAFQLLLDSAVQNGLEQSDMPSHIIVVSDMEFDDGVFSKGGTNFQGWKKAFEEAGYVLPKIIFWNVAATTNGFPVTQNDGDVCMISGFSTTILQTILDVENFNPVDVMMETLKKYVEILKED